MVIKNIRLGHACNSSSSHSIILFSPGDKEVYDDMIERFRYGWSHFTIASEEEKKYYLATLLYVLLNNTHGYHYEGRMVNSFVKDYLSVKLPDEDFDSIYIDHQSVPTMPTNRQGSLNLQFFEDYMRFILREGVAIIGGNDNYSDEDNTELHPLYGYKNPEWTIPQDYPGKIFAKKQGDFWVLFNTLNGFKTTISFEDNPVMKRTSPDLVDLKITDYCPFECSFCYMGSDKKGKHADFYTINMILSTCESQGVFEIALGGGEPTLHPDFLRILDEYNHRLTINFTTKSTHWLKDPKMWTKILPKIGRFAFSVQNSSELLSFLDIVEKNEIGREKYTIQIVDKTLPLLELVEVSSIIRTKRINVTILGFKETHRGQEFAKQATPWHKVDWGHRVGIDTAIVQQYPDVMKQIPHQLYHGNEGVESMYINACTMGFAKSSYEQKLIPIPKKPKMHFPDFGNIFETFQKWNEEGIQ